MDFVTSAFPNIVIFCTQLREGKTKDYLHKVLNKPHVSSASEKEMATHSSILAWRIPWTEEPGRPRSIGSQRVGHG